MPKFTKTYFHFNVEFPAHSSLTVSSPVGRCSLAPSPRMCGAPSMEGKAGPNANSFTASERIGIEWLSTRPSQKSSNWLGEKWFHNVTKNQKTEADISPLSSLPGIVSSSTSSSPPCIVTYWPSTHYSNDDTDDYRVYHFYDDDDDDDDVEQV